MNTPKRHAGNLGLLGGALCLDFTNTLDWRGREEPIEYLNAYVDLISWCRHAKLISPKAKKTLIHEASKKPHKAGTVLKQAVLLREAMYRIFISEFERKRPSTKDLDLFNKALSRAMGRMKIVKAKSGFTWEIGSPGEDLDWIIIPILRSAAELLVSPDLKRVKRCGDAACGWLFLDISKNRSRRWCDMTDCGNRAKANRFYKRKQSPSPTSSKTKL